MSDPSGAYPEPAASAADPRLATSTPPDIGPRRQQPAVIFLDAVRSVGGLVVPFVLFVFAGGGERQLWFLGFAVLYMVISIAAQFVGWRNYTYAVAEGEFREQSGIFERKDRLIPLERIQAVDINETPLQRIFGVVGVRIETAAGGGSEADVRISALSRADAEALRQRLSVNPRTVSAASAAAVPAPDGEPAPAYSPRAGGPATLAPVSAAGAATEAPPRRLSWGSLLLAGLTSGTIGPALAVVGFLTQFADDILPEEIWARWAMAATTLSPRTLIPLVFGVAVLAWLLALAGAILTYGNFELRRTGDRVVLSYGLLERRRRTVPVARMQALVIKEGLLRRPFGLASLHFESAGYGDEAGKSGVLWPLLRRSDVAAFIAAEVPEMARAVETDELAGPPPRALSRYVLLDVVSWLIFGAVGLAITWVLDAGVFFRAASWVEPWWGALIFLALPLVVVNAWLRYRDAGWRIVDESLLVLVAGGLVRVTTIIPRRRLQRLVLATNLLQRRAGLTTLRAAVASGGEGGRAAVEHLDVEVAGEVVQRMAPPPLPPERRRQLTGRGLSQAGGLAGEPRAAATRQA